MSYAGNIVAVPIGSIGIESDESADKVTPGSLILATNVNCRYGGVEKEGGSVRWNQTPLAAGVAAFYDWWPDGINQRMIVCCKNGRVYRFPNAFVSSEVAATGTAAFTLNFSNQTSMVQGGAEDVGRPRKLFIYSGNDPIQVISGDGLLRNVMSKPAADWTVGNYPTGGLIAGHGHYVWGNQNNPHMLYRSSLTDHEDFQTFGSFALIPVFPGDGDAITQVFSWKTLTFVVKKPFGLFYVNDTDPTNVFVQKLSGSFGGISNHCAQQVLDDVMIANTSGSISSLNVVQALGGVEQGDLMKMLKALQFIREHAVSNGAEDRHTLYVEDKKQFYVSCRSPSGTKNDRIIKIDYHADNPKFTFTDKDQPNCLGLVRDFRNIGQPFYGAEDGYLYQTDHPMRNVGGSAFTGTFQTNWIDFGYQGPNLKEKDKIFDFIGVTCEARGHWDLNCDVFIDDRFIETITFKMDAGTYMDGHFQLDRDRLAGPGAIPPNVKPVHGMGKRISLKFYQAGLNQSFRVTAVQFYFRVGGQVNT